MTSEVGVVKRCVDCGICPQPKDMEFFFGKGWRYATKCLDCWAKKFPSIPPVISDQLTTPRKTYIAFVSKLAGLEPKQIQEWFVPVLLRKAASQKRYQTEDGKYPEVWLSDGIRYWDWSRVPWNLEAYQNWENFRKDHPRCVFLREEDYRPPDRSCFPHIAV